MMKTRLSGTFLHVLLCSSTVFGLTSMVSRRYWYETVTSTWTNAQSFCKKFYTDLAIFYTDSDLSQTSVVPYHSWVGLYRNSAGRNEWMWTDGTPSTFTDSTVDTTANCGMVVSNRGFSTRNCGDLLFFICQKGNLFPKFYFIFDPMDWSQARTYCRKNYDDLGSFENYDLKQITFRQDFPIWIGMYKDGGSWSWTTGDSNYMNWNTSEPRNNGDCAFITSITKKMAVKDCNKFAPFICISDNVVLVKVNKTWEEALQHCRGLTSPTNSKLLFDLVSVNPGREQDSVMGKVMAADTEEVWTGLRFLADEWLWINGADMLYTDLPLCPIPGYHCGAFSKTDNGSVKARNCSERKNFLCYSYS